MAAPLPRADGDLDAGLATDLDLDPDPDPDPHPHPDAPIDLGSDDLVIDLTKPLQHRPELIEAGSFTSARCQACGWSGPARRARAVALADLERHATRAEPARPA